MKVKQVWKKLIQNKKLVFLVSILFLFILLGVIIYIFRDTGESQTSQEGELYQLKNGIYISDQVDVHFDENKNITSVNSDIQEIEYDYIYEDHKIKKISYSGIFNQLDVEGSIEFTYENDLLQKIKLNGLGYRNYTEEYFFYYDQNQKLNLVTNTSNAGGRVGVGTCYLYYEGDYVIEQCEKSDVQSTYFAKRIYKNYQSEGLPFWSEYQFLPFIEFLYFFENHQGNSYLSFFYRNDDLMTPVSPGRLLHEEVIINEDGKETKEQKDNYIDEKSHVIQGDIKDYGTTYIKYNDQSFTMWVDNRLMESYQKNMGTLVKEKDKIVGYRVREEKLTQKQFENEIENFQDPSFPEEVQFIIDHWNQVVNEKFREQFVVAPTIQADIPEETNQPTLNFQYQITHSTDDIQFAENEYMDTKIFDYQTEVHIFLNDENVDSMCDFETGSCSVPLKNGTNKLVIQAENNFQQSSSETYQIVFQAPKPQITLKNNVINSFVTHDGRIMEGDYLYLTLSKPIWEIQLELYCDNQLWMDHYMTQSDCSIQSDSNYQCFIPQIVDWRYAHSGIHSCYMQMQDEYGQTSRADFQINYH